MTDQPDSDAFDELHRRCSNWGRWGSGDQRGALNNITPEAVVAACHGVRSGVSVSCARPLDTTPAIDNPRPVEHIVVRRPAVNPASGVSFGSDAVTIHCHGEVHSHLDSLSHVAYRGRLFNGWDAAAADGRLPGTCDLSVIADGVTARGVLLDLPRLLGTRWLPPGYAVSTDELDAAAAAQNLTLVPGDVVLIRTGHATRRKHDGPWDSAAAKAGIDPAAMPWFRTHDASMLGFDGDGDAAPHRFEPVIAPIHVLGINSTGLHFLDALDLDDLAEQCASHDRWHFLFTVAPLRLRFGTGCAVNPTAMF